MNTTEFSPEPSLIKGKPHPDCVASVIIPARDEESSLPTALDAFASQVGLDGRPLSFESFEVIVLLNNCTDDSAGAVKRWQAMHPQVAVHRVECMLHEDVAHVGTARRMLMDTAWRRLTAASRATRGILSTDSDTLVAPDWITQNLRALGRGADAVGGVIRLHQGDLESLPAGARRAYVQDRRYQRLVAELESLLDPQAGDPWPRHLEHFGASLACTPEIYARAGGMPAVKPLEDIAFVDALRRVDARLRHAPEVIVSTSGRLDGRVDIGLSQQLRMWQQMSEEGTQQVVESAAWLCHRFTSLHCLRAIWSAAHTLKVEGYSAAWCERIVEARWRCDSVAQFLGEIDCDRLIEETFKGRREESVAQASYKLAAAIQQSRNPLGAWSHERDEVGAGFAVSGL